MAQNCEILDFIHDSLYYEGKFRNNTRIGDDMMSEVKDTGKLNLHKVGVANELLDTAIEECGIMKMDAAASIGWTLSQMCNRMARNTIRADEFLGLMDAIGVEVNFKVKKTGEFLTLKSDEQSPRIQMMVNGEKYDTAKATLIASDFYADGENMYTDGRARALFIDRNGVYFFAEYVEWDASQNRILPVPAAEALKFVEKYRKGNDSEDV